MAFFLFLLPVSAEIPESSNTGFQSKLVLKQSNNLAIKALRKYRDGLLNENQGQLFFNLDQVNIQNSNSEELQINFILVDDKDFYLATDLGIFQNYRQIFSKENCSHIEKTSKNIYIACENGIYKTELDSKTKFQKFNWQILANSPRQVNYFTLNKSKTNLDYAVSRLGFHSYNSHKQNWTLSNYGLTRNFQEEFKLGRFLKYKDLNKNEQILLPSALGVMTSPDDGKTWVKNNSGIESDADGFYTIRELVEFGDHIWAIASTGLYYKPRDSKLGWERLQINHSKKDEFANQNFYAIDKNNTELFVANSQGEVFQISVGTLKASIASTQESRATEELLELLKIEPKIQDVHIAALEFSGIPTGKSFKQYRKHARIRNLLPELQTYVEKTNLSYIAIETRGSDNLETSSGNYDSSFDRNDVQRNNNNINAGLRFNWKLGNLIFDPEINDINTSARITANVRENILTEVTQLYFRRKELLVKAFSEAEHSLSSRLELDELLAQLDARTGAWYSEELHKNLKNIDIDSDLKEFYYES